MAPQALNEISGENPPPPETPHTNRHPTPTLQGQGQILIGQQFESIPKEL